MDQDKDKDLTIKTLNKAIIEVKTLREEMVTNKKHVDEINIIIDKLKKLQSALSPQKKWFDVKINSLDLLIKELKEIRFDIITNSKEEMFKNINQNLANGMKLNVVSENRGELTDGSDVIGTIDFKEENNKALEIIVEAFGKTDKFTVEDPAIMIPIISFININYLYHTKIKNQS